MSRFILSTSLMAGALLLAACSSSSPTDPRTAQAALTPITLAQVSAPDGYRFVGTPDRVPVRQTGTADRPIWEMAPLRVVPNEAPAPEWAAATKGGEVSALR